VVVTVVTVAIVVVTVEANAVVAVVIVSIDTGNRENGTLIPPLINYSVHLFVAATLTKKSTMAGVVTTATTELKVEEAANVDAAAERRHRQRMGVEATDGGDPWVYPFPPLPLHLPPMTGVCPSLLNGETPPPRARRTKAAGLGIRSKKRRTILSLLTSTSHKRPRRRLPSCPNWRLARPMKALMILCGRMRSQCRRTRERLTSPPRYIQSSLLCPLVLIFVFPQPKSAPKARTGRKRKSSSKSMPVRPP